MRIGKPCWDCQFFAHCRRCGGSARGGSGTERPQSVTLTSVAAVVLDFDGVISDSGREAFVTAGRTWASMCPGSRLVRFLRPILDEGLPSPEVMDGDPLYSGFMAVMPLGNRAEDFGVALAALEAGLSLSDQASYDRFRAGLDQDWLEQFHLRFYQVRAELRAADPGGWRNLQRPFPAMVLALLKNFRRVPVAIATAKDRASVAVLLEDYGLAHVFQPELIADKECGRSKRSHLQLLQGRLGVSWPDISFVDDKLNHLEAVAQLGVRGILAGWGYNGDRERLAAKSKGFLVLDPAHIGQVLFP